MSTIVLFCTIPVKVERDATIGELEKAIKDDFNKVASQDFMQLKVNSDKEILQLDFEAKSVEKVCTNESFDYMHLVIEPPGFTVKSEEVLKIKEPLAVVLSQIKINPVPPTNSGPRSLIKPFVCKFTQDGQDCVDARSTQLSFATQKELELHVNTVHMCNLESVSPGNLCPWKGCNKSECDFTQLKEHLGKHIDQKPFKCLFCAKDQYMKNPYRFGSLNRLARHVIVNHEEFTINFGQEYLEDEHKYKCPFCLDILHHFGYFNELKMHLRNKHADVTRNFPSVAEEVKWKFKCSLCLDSNRFGSLNTLAKHFIIDHPNVTINSVDVNRMIDYYSEYPSICTKKFPFFKCSHSRCLYRFGSLNTLARHLVNTHKKDIVDCDGINDMTCNSLFTNGDKLYDKDEEVYEDDPKNLRSPLYHEAFDRCDYNKTDKDNVPYEVLRCILGEERMEELDQLEKLGQMEKLDQMEELDQPD